MCQEHCNNRHETCQTASSFYTQYLAVAILQVYCFLPPWKEKQKIGTPFHFTMLCFSLTKGSSVKRLPLIMVKTCSNLKEKIACQYLVKRVGFDFMCFTLSTCINRDGDNIEESRCWILSSERVKTSAGSMTRTANPHLSPRFCDSS